MQRLKLDLAMSGPILNCDVIEIDGIPPTESYASTVQYRPSEKKIVFGLKVPSIDGLGLILWLK